jgi:hypothetical protein
MIANAVAAMKQIAQNPDTEVAHGDADILLCQLLRELGAADLVAEWRKVAKRY